MGSRTIPFFILIILLTISSCAQVPKESIELSNTVGRDLEEVHRAHRALADLYFDSIEQEINRFIDNEYRPSYVKLFAENFQLTDKITIILANKPDDLLIVMQKFVEIAMRDVDAKRNELLSGIQDQRRKVISEIDDSYRKIQAAHAVITGHLASVRKVHDAQAEILKEVGVGDLREKLAKKTATLSGDIRDITKNAEGFYKKLEKFNGDPEQKLNELNGIAADIDGAIQAAN